MRVLILIATLLSGAVVLFFVIGTYATNHFTGTVSVPQRFEVISGADAFTLGKQLEEKGIVFSRFAFLWHVFYEQKTQQIIAGTYLLSGKMPIPEITQLVTSGKTISRDIRVTFPEGWTQEKMAERLTSLHLPGSKFLELSLAPLPEWREKYDFLTSLPEGASLEGFLFPDTYLFAPEVTAEDIITSLLQNFGKKLDTILAQASGATVDPKRLYAIVTLASIIEEEGQTKEEREMISDIFWKRLAIGQPLQSDATVNYIHGTTRLQPTFKDIEADSPYNTYKNVGLPPGPISNPGLMSIRASIYPKSNPYYYFLVSATTGQTIYSKTFEEHVRNRTEHGL